jgi:hypothetical protein
MSKITLLLCTGTAFALVAPLSRDCSGNLGGKYSIPLYKYILDQDVCKDWQTFYDATGGDSWTLSKASSGISCRFDPCNCNLHKSYTSSIAVSCAKKSYKPVPAPTPVPCNLITVRVTNNNLVGEWSGLTENKMLGTLVVHGEPKLGGSFPSLEKLEALLTLDLQGLTLLNFTLASLQSISTMKSITTLSIDSMPGVQGRLPSLSGLEGLKSLTLRKTGLNGALPAHLPPNLDQLSIKLNAFTSIPEGFCDDAVKTRWMTDQSCQLNDVWGEKQSFLCCPTTKNCDTIFKPAPPPSPGPASSQNATCFPFAGSNTCHNCPCGNYLDADTFLCSNCGAGQYSTVDKSCDSKCSSCPPGKYSGEQGSCGCTGCPRGYYSEIHGMSKCTACAPGQQGGDSNRSRPALACTDCVAGRYARDNGTATCSECAGGTFQPNARSASCLDCPAGRHGDDHKNKTSLHEQCSNCNPGRYSSSPRQTECARCDIGQYQGSSGLASCSKCPGGTHGWDWGDNITGYTREDLQCKPCYVGHADAVEGNGNIYCESCGAGQYQDRPGQQTCRQCTSGRFSGDREANTACTLCASGFLCYGSAPPLHLRARRCWLKNKK